MADEVSLHRRIERGRKAATLLDDDFFKEAIDAVTADCVKMFATSAIDDDVKRSYARAKLDAINGVRESIRWYVQDAKMAADTLNIEARIKQGRA